MARHTHAYSILVSQRGWCFASHLAPSLHLTFGCCSHHFPSLVYVSFRHSVFLCELFWTIWVSYFGLLLFLTHFSEKEFIRVRRPQSAVSKMPNFVNLNDYSTTRQRLDGEKKTLNFVIITRRKTTMSNKSAHRFSWSLRLISWLGTKPEQNMDY